MKQNCSICDSFHFSLAMINTTLSSTHPPPSSLELQSSHKQEWRKGSTEMGVTNIEYSKRPWASSLKLCITYFLNAYWSVGNKNMSVLERKPELSRSFYLPYQEPETSITGSLASKIISYSKVERLVNKATKEIFIPSTRNMLVLRYYNSIKMFSHNIIYILLENQVD